ncbi:MAG: sulfatase [Puniceicoccaceae bacterium]
MKQLHYLFAALLLITASYCAAASKPNLIFILVDDLGYGDLSSYGATDLETPRIDRLMGESLRFNQFYANCTVCSPTRASLLTGRYPDNVGVPGVIRQNPANSWGYFDPNAVTLPDMLNKAGYHTAIIGKWHLGYEAPNRPNDRGFDFFHGFLGDMMDDYYTHRRGGINWMRKNHKEIDPEGHATELFSDWAIDYLNDRKDKPEPFFLYLAYNAPHFPIQPPDDWLKRTRKKLPELSEGRAKNVAFVEHMDHYIGKVLDALETTGLRDSTLVVFSSDNGGSLRHHQRNGNLRGGKQDHWEGGIRVPTCVSWPGKIRNEQVDTVAMTMDFYPTFCELAGVPVKHKIDGKSILPFLLEGDASSFEDRDLIWVRREGGNSPSGYQGRPYYAIRRGPWKLQQSNPFEPMQLFNLDKDPLETTPVQNEAIAKELRASLMLHFQEAAKVPWQQPE